jgi:hypothetical protein
MISLKGKVAIVTAVPGNRFCRCQDLPGKRRQGCSLRLPAGDCGPGAGGAQGDQPGLGGHGCYPELSDRKSVEESFDQVRRKLGKLIFWSITPA